ncbi:putative fatty acyl-CoA reductase CG8303 [Contarinia nasturtii]|uniref:putative fatty acyl-CoA reductase CG8303 n=1 Tax=Contarinia nasturtii TaxID=265458 RepID=UPI0012D3C6D0|nr:putative fatty acyl-CoA reductase CG8303 [Contarinia nasturtii]XP_031630614.1 putative fatty acyl-CoA reductase CG8303 [Contarinia nasturtii]XP_031630615.1 putative fatty acyl-CoA reductase CG8303 [Contarinia nasturtii]XP_031630616.1 putative fatty acyl-CoA reductase CG8303 [Contarinia nasturtii]
MALNNNEVSEPCIAEFYAGKSVFITGGTGFLGTVLIEALLTSTPKIGTIYLLIRDKYGSDTRERIKRLLSKQIFQSHSAETLKKVVPVVGVMDAENMGFSDEILKELRENVNIIFHVAATIKFNTHLREAIRTNLTGTMRCIEFGKSLKKLDAFVHLSTAFCNSNYGGLLEEKVYAPAQDPYDMLKMAENNEAWNDIKARADWLHITKDHPNTYTFTKQLAENLVMKELAGFPAAIVRPSIVYGTYEYPVEGWVGNASSGHLGFFAGYYKGLFRTIYGNSQSKIDLIPVDYTINASLVLGWYVGTRKLELPEVVHSTSGDVNPITLGEYTDIINDRVRVHPSQTMVWIPSAKIRNGLRYTVYFYLFQILPTMLWYWPEKLLGLGIKHHTSLEFMRIFNKGIKAFHFFLNKNFQYSTKNAMRIGTLMHPKDMDRYKFDASDIDWSEMIERNFSGVRRYYFREKGETSLKHAIIYAIFKTLQYIGLAIMIWWSYKLCTGINWMFGLDLSSPVLLSLGLLLGSFLIWL